MELFAETWFVTIAGGLLVALVTALVRHAIGKSKAESVVTRTSAITAQEIADKLSDTPVLQRKGAAEFYKGLKVRWTVELGSVQQFMWKHSVYADSPDSWLAVSLPVRLARYPQLKLMKRGQEFVVEGTIASIDRYIVNLKNCQLFFDSGKLEPKHEGVDKPMSASHGDTATQVLSTGSQPTTPSAVAGPTSRVSPADILNHLGSLPPLQVEEAAKHYLGIEVEWTVTLLNVHTMDDGTQYLNTHTPGIIHLITCPIDLALYPQLKIMTRDEEFTIHGTIVSVDRLEIHLDKCRLVFPP